jgi:hypothetical protein
MKEIGRRVLVFFLSVQLSLAGLAVEGCAARAGQDSALARIPPGVSSTGDLTVLRALLQESYADLFDLASTQKFTSAQIEAQRKSLDKGRDFCVGRFKDHTKQYEKEVDAAQKDLKKKTAKLTQQQRSQLHCKIQNLEFLRSEAQALSGHAIPTAYDNLQAKLDLIEKWPELYKQTQQEIASESYLHRRWGDVKDIGFWEIAANQQDDIKKGQQAVEEMKRSGLLPPEVENKAIQEYVNSVAQRIAQKSDLKIPLHVSVLQSREINAFALPGGYLFIERGLLEAADDESELAGVLAHEMAHDAARHANKLMKRATIAGTFYQAAQVAAMILTGGFAGIGTYYALQHSFYGLGLVLNLDLLGVSREYELEADQLGVQYAWNSGYDPSGFIRFSESMFLTPKPDMIVQTSAFEQMKKELAPVVAAASKEEMKRPSLKMTLEEGCEPPKKLEYTPGQPIEDLCAAPPRRVNRTASKSEEAESL